MRIPLPAAQFLLLIVMAVAVAQPSYPANIQQMNYQFYYDGNAREHGPQLIHAVCDKCPAVTRLSLAPKMPPVAIRMSEDIVAAPSIQPASKQPQRATVYFDKNSHVLKRQEKFKLFDFSRKAKEMRSTGKNTAVRVEGYTCDLGSKKTNDRLAKKRAMAVSGLLNKEGVQNTPSGKGKCCYVTDDPAERGLNRRVEVTITD